MLQFTINGNMDSKKSEKRVLQKSPLQAIANLQLASQVSCSTNLIQNPECTKIGEIFTKKILV